MRRRVAWLLLPILMFSGCTKNPDQTSTPISTSPAVLSAEVQNAVIQRGRAIVAETFSLLSSNLQSAIRLGGISNALPFCSLAASPLTAGLAGKHGVTIHRVTHKPRNPANRADTTELAVLKHFEATLSGTNLPSAVLTNLTASTVTFFAPIVLQNELCLRCHGDPIREIAPENVAVIRQLYPDDEATGFKLGQLRGAWRIDIPLASLSTAP